MKEIELKPFSLELKTIAGYYDGTRSRIHDSALASPIVSIHESIHQRIFKETPDGQIHSLFVIYLENKSLKEEDRKVITKSLEIFIESSRLPHEAFATYLSIKNMPPDIESDLLLQHSKEYQSYYKIISDVIDKHYKCSYLQYLIVWNLAILIFSSPLLERLESIDIRIPVNLSEDENSTIRFNLLMNKLKLVDYNALTEKLILSAKKSCDLYKFKYWDILSETEWEKALYDKNIDSVLIENDLSITIQDWLISISPFAYLIDNRLIGAYEKFKKTLSEKFHIETELLSRDYSERTIRNDFKDASDSAKSRIINSTPLYNPQKVAIDDIDAVLNEVSSFSIYSLSPHLQSSDLNFHFRSNKKDASIILRVEKDTAISFLKKWMKKKQLKEQCPLLDSIILATENHVDFIRDLAADNYFLVNNKELSSKLCWYWWGDITDVYSLSLIDGAIMYIGEIHSTKINDIKKENANEYIKKILGEYNEIVIRLIEYKIGSESVGLLVRAYPFRVSSVLSRYEDKLINQNKVIRMPEEMIINYTPMASEALHAAQLLWPEY